MPVTPALGRQQGCAVKQYFNTSPRHPIPPQKEVDYSKIATDCLVDRANARSSAWDLISLLFEDEF